MPTARPDSYTIASGADLYAGIAAPSPPPPPPPSPGLLSLVQGDTSKTVGVATSGWGVQNDGETAATAVLAVSPAEATLSANNFSVSAGAFVAFALTGLVSGSKSVSLTTSTVGASVSAPSTPKSISFTAAPPPPSPAPPPAPNLTRLTNTTLFADVAAGTTVVDEVVGGSTIRTLPARASVASPKQGFVVGLYGPSADYVDNYSKWTWRNQGGDWIDDNGTWQGTAAPHFTFAANSVTSGSATYTGIAVTSAAKAAFWRGKWNAFVVKCAGGSRTLAALHHPTLAAPVMHVTYADATTATLACLACVRLTTGTAYTQIGMEEALISQSVALEFAMPTKEVASATIDLVVSQHSATAATISGYIVNPPTNYVEEDFGISQNYGWDSGISAHPNVLFSQQITTANLSDYVITSLGSVDFFDSANWSPAVIGLSGTVDDTKLPTALSGTAVAGTNKWVYKIATPSNISVVAPSYTGDGFVPPPSGHGALRIVCPGDSSADGAEVGNGGSLGSDLMAPFDKTRAGLVDTVNIRFMYRYHLTGGVPDIDTVKMFRANAGSQAEYAIPLGKFGIGAHHLTSTGGQNNIGGGNLGWSNRLGNVDVPSALPVNTRSIFMHVQDMIGVNFAIGKDGGMGATLYPDVWNCVEIQLQLNTYNESTGVASSDGVAKAWVNGRLDCTHVGWKFREGVVPAQSATDLKPFKRQGAWGVWLNDYIGGVKPIDRDQVHFYADIVVTDGVYIGQPAPPLPTWVPAAGSVTSMTVANGLLTNNFRSTVAAYYNDYYLAGTADNYNGAVLNPHYGPYGAMIFNGGGHSYSNNNSNVQLDFGFSSSTFRSLNNPTPLFGTGTDTTTKDNNDTANVVGTLVNLADLTYTTDGQPASSHSYGDQVVVAPHHAGGAAFGAYYQLLREGPSRTYNANGAEAPFKMDFDTYQASEYTYSKAGVVRFAGSNLNITGGPNWSVHVPAQNRIYIEAHNGGRPVRWFDLMLRKYVDGTGTQLTGTGQGNGGQMLYVPSRNLILLGHRSAGVLQIRYLDVSSLDPSWNNTPVTLSSSITVSDDWSEMALCPTTGKLLIGNTAAGGAVVYEITIPPSLASSWTVASTTIGGGGSIAYRGAGVGIGYNRWAYNPRTRTINYLVKAAYDNTMTAQEVLYAYRPLGT